MARKSEGISDWLEDGTSEELQESTWPRRSERGLETGAEKQLDSPRDIFIVLGRENKFTGPFNGYKPLWQTKYTFI